MQNKSIKTKALGQKACSHEVMKKTLFLEARFPTA